MRPETPSLLLATTLMELSLFLTQGRAVFPYHRIRSVALEDELSRQALFETLPVADYSEEQAFFVLVLNAAKVELSGSVLSPVCEIRLADVLSLHPVTESGKEIFNGSQRLPGVVLADAQFESAWHSFVSNRYSAQTLGMAIDFADEIVPCSLLDLGSIATDFKAGIVAKHLDLEQAIQSPFSRFVYEILNYKRETEGKYQNLYDSEELRAIFIDLFRIIVASGAPESLRNLGIEFVKSPLFKKDLLIDQDGLINLFSDKEYQSIIQKIAEYYACSPSWFNAAILYLCIRLDKQNGKARNLEQSVDAIRSRGAFDAESTRLGLLLVALPESQSSLNEFVNASKQNEFGIFNLSPVQLTEKVRLFEKNSFETIANLMTAKIVESEITIETTSEPSEPAQTENGSEESKDAPNSEGDDGILPTEVGTPDSASSAEAEDKATAIPEVPAEATTSKAEPTEVDVLSDT
jgi:hypothetical protein